MQRSETNQTCVMDEDEIERTLVRMAHQILEQNKGCENLALVGILTRGDILARKLADIIYSIEGVHVPVGSLDISFYRDDASISGLPQLHGTDILFNIDNKTIVLVDDVLFTGRTIRAALDALMDFGAPSAYPACHPGRSWSSRTSDPRRFRGQEHPVFPERECALAPEGYRWLFLRDHFADRAR